MCNLYGKDNSSCWIHLPATNVVGKARWEVSSCSKNHAQHELHHEPPLKHFKPFRFISTTFCAKCEAHSQRLCQAHTPSSDTHDTYSSSPWRVHVLACLFHKIWCWIDSENSVFRTRKMRCAKTIKSHLRAIYRTRTSHSAGKDACKCRDACLAVREQFDAVIRTQSQKNNSLAASATKYCAVIILVISTLFKPSKHAKQS